MAAFSVDGAPGSPMHQQLLSPLAHMPSPCSSTHPRSPARTLWLCCGTLKKHTALSLKLLLVLRVQVGSEATDPIL